MRYFRSKVCQLETSEQFQKLLDQFLDLFYPFIQKTGGDEHDFNRCSNNIRYRIIKMRESEQKLAEDSESTDLRRDVNSSARQLRMYFQEFHNLSFSESNQLTIEARLIEYENEIEELEKHGNARPVMREQLAARRDYYLEHYPTLASKLAQFPILSDSFN
ncbi:hypothetical protein GZH47_33305 (plasmid) [Paenibacillus rhizovicinus]|uniref:Uncharacterized protein n=1 Tax=Paenibacillus rhizovicinus TaxID=2704463 RepID=A0A6C0PCK6_9BACL|nr:hypothetical protein [Paenibacillus rhizovicinus]QHW35773.1 hypothetical protein GZH47_33305 [Paenibacillus rhizovicinus]